jgi:hypothetical protein
MFGMIILAHVVLIVFGLGRMRTRPAPEQRTAYLDEPRTSFLIGKLLGRFRDR